MAKDLTAAKQRAIKVDRAAAGKLAALPSFKLWYENVGLAGQFTDDDFTGDEGHLTAADEAAWMKIVEKINEALTQEDWDTIAKMAPAPQA